MSAPPPNPSSQQQNPQGGYAPPGGAPPTTGAPAAQGAPAGQGAYPPPGGAPPGQQPYSPYPPQGGYAPPPGGYYPPPGQYYPPPGQYPYHPGYYPPPGQYYPPPGQYPPYPPAGQYPPPAGTPGAPGAPGAPATPGAPGAPATPAAGAASAAPGTPGQQPPPAAQNPPYGAPPAGQYPPPPGQYPPPGGAPPPPGQSPYGAYPMPAATPGYPGAPGAPGQPGYYAPPPLPYHHPQDPLFYLGTAIPDPAAPPATHGAQKVPGYDPAHDYNSIVRSIVDGVGNETQLLKIITNLNVFQMDALNDYHTAKSGISLAERLERSTTGNFGTAIRALALGPLGFDVDLARKALAGMGTNETLLIELILGRPGHEIRWLKTGYRLRYGKDLVDAVKGDLSGKTERMFTMALNTQKPVDSPYAPIDQEKVAADIETLHNASKKRDEIAFCEVLINRSDSHLGAVITGYSTRYKSLSKIIKKTFSGTMQDGLLYIMHGVKPKRDRQGFWRDGKLLEKTMAGLGTKDNMLIYRLVRAHWNPQRMEAIKDAYKRRFGKALENRVKGETSGPYRDLLLTIVKSSEGKSLA